MNIDNNNRFDIVSLKFEPLNFYIRVTDIELIVTVRITFIL